MSQPVSGTEMALATPKLVMTQVPWLGLTPTSPEMAGMATLAMEESSTFMKVASDRASVPSTSGAPLRGAMAGMAVGGSGGALPGPVAPVSSGAAEEGEVMADFRVLLGRLLLLLGGLGIGWCGRRLGLRGRHLVQRCQRGQFVA